MTGLAVILAIALLVLAYLVFSYTLLLIFVIIEFFQNIMGV